MRDQGATATATVGVGVLVGPLSAAVVGVVDGVIGFLLGFVVGGIGGVIAVAVTVVGGVEIGERRGTQVSAHLRSVPPIAPRTLRWVRGLLPSDEGAAWLAEVTSCLAETHDKGERRRYVRSYRRGVPWLIWTSWVLHLSGSQSRDLL